MVAAMFRLANDAQQATILETVQRLWSLRVFQALRLELPVDVGRFGVSARDGEGHVTVRRVLRCRSHTAEIERSGPLDLECHV